jgi:hypothetical protein
MAGRKTSYSTVVEGSAEGNHFMCALRCRMRALRRERQEFLNYLTPVPSAMFTVSMYVPGGRWGTEKL